MWAYNIHGGTFHCLKWRTQMNRPDLTPGQQLLENSKNELYGYFGAKSVTEEMIVNHTLAMAIKELTKLSIIKNGTS
jgi:hypothetical protein